MASADVAQVLPKELRLGAPPQMPQARSYMFKQPSTLSSYKSDTQTTIQINLPRLQRSYLTKDSYLKFKLNITHTPGANQDGLNFDTPGAYGLFDKIEVFDYLGSTSLESISGFGQLMGLLLDIHTDTVESGTHSAIIDGTLGGACVSTSPGNQLLTTTGKVLIPTGLTASTAAYRAYEFSIPLFSFLGLLSPKFAPLHNGYTIMLTLNQPNTSFVQISGPTTGAAGTISPYTISEMNLHCQVLELGPVAESMLLSSTGGQPLVVHCKSFRRYTGAVKNQPEFKIPLNLNVASLTNILWFMRSKADIDGDAFPSLGNRIRAYLQNWYFQYGSSVLPQTTGIQAMAQTLGTNAGSITNVDQKLAIFSDGCRENYAELLKARHAWNSATHTTQISPNSYEWDLAWTAELDKASRKLIKGTGVTSGTPTATTAILQNLTTIPIKGDVVVVGTTAAGNVVSYAQDTGLLTWSTSITAPAAGVTVTVYAPKTFAAYTPYGIGKFACGLDLELVSGKSNELISGLNTNGMNTMIAGRFHPDYYDEQYSTGTTQDTIIMDAYAEYDAFINISPGIATTVSF